MGFDYTSLLRKDLAAPAAPWGGYPELNFVGGHNDPASVPADQLAEAAKRVIAREGRSLATYNMDHGPLGYLPLRQLIADKLHQVAEISCDADQVLVTSGSLQAIDLVNDVFVEPGDTVIVEAETYGGALARLRRAGADWVGIDVDDDGLRTDRLEATLAEMKARGVRPKYIYTIPTVQNPTGTVMTRERRLELLRIAGEYDVPIFEDDCYADLLWDGERPPAIHALDQTGRVMYCGSFSKSLAPALRIGYLVADWSVLSRVLTVKFDGGTGAFEQMTLAEYAAEHFDGHVSRLRQTLKAKCAAMVDALEEQFGVAAEYRVPRGGIFIWVKFPDAVDTTQLVQAAVAERLLVNPGADWVADPETGRHSIRLCFGNPSIDTIREGVARLAEICNRETGIPERSANVARA
jgi:2-aminoadipate transaminase